MSFLSGSDSAIHASVHLRIQVPPQSAPDKICCIAVSTIHLYLSSERILLATPILHIERVNKNIVESQLNTIPAIKTETHNALAAKPSNCIVALVTIDTGKLHINPLPSVAVFRTACSHKKKHCAHILVLCFFFWRRFAPARCASFTSL